MHFIYACFFYWHFFIHPMSFGSGCIYIIFQFFHPSENFIFRWQFLLIILQTFTFIFTDSSEAPLIEKKPNITIGFVHIFQ